MPRKGFTSITIPEYYYTRIVNFAERHGLTVGQAVALLYELYYSMISDPGLTSEVLKKLDKAKKRIQKNWRKVIEESKTYE